LFKQNANNSIKNKIKTTSINTILLFFSIYLCFGILEITSFCILAFKQNVLKTSVKADMNFLYNAGLPRIFKPIGYNAESPGPWPLLMSSSPAYKNDRWANDFWRYEHRRYQIIDETFQPNVIWRSKYRRELYVNIDKEGIRKTINPIIDNPKKQIDIFMFGGSTMYGTGVPDQFTIPSILSKMLNENGNVFYKITNFGTGSYIINQDMQLLFDVVRKNNIPKIVIFYNGINDTFSGVFSPGKPGWYLGSEQIEKKLVSVQKNEKWKYMLNTMKLAAKVKNKLFTKELDNLFLNDYEKKAKAFIDYYKKSILLIRNVCEYQNIVPIFIWQPHLLFGNKPNSEFEKALIKNPTLLSIGSFNQKEGIYLSKAMKTTYTILENEGVNIHGFYNFSRIFDDIKETLFLDYMHLGREGNTIVSKQIVKIINEYNVIFMKSQK